MKKRIIPYIVIFVLIISACQTAPVATDIESVNETYDFFSETRELIRNPSDTLFWTEIESNGEKYPEESAKLIDEYVIFQKDLIRHYLDRNDFMSARFHLNNLKAVPEQEGAFITFEMLEEETDLLSSHLNEERNKTLFSEGLPLDAESVDPALYSESLAVIKTNYKWETDEGIERANVNDLAGSGFLITPRHVLTAFHVVDVVFDEDLLESSISVELGEEIFENVNLISWDSLTDLAVLELPVSSAHPYLYEKLMHVAEPQSQGDTVYALGHPFGYTYTFSKGIVSALDRSAPEWGKWIQIDASVGPGSSGGLLLNENGDVAGLIVAGLSGEELNFAVPSPLIKEIIDPLIDGETVRRPWCGLMFGMNDQSLKLRHIFEESPLAGTKLQRGDSLIAVNGNPVETLDDAKDAINSLLADNLISLTFSNGEGEKDYRLKMMRRPDYALYNKIVRMDAFDRLAVAADILVDTEEQFAEKIASDDAAHFFLSFPVLDIEENSILYKLGIREGDRLGLIEDNFNNIRYSVTVMHIPNGRTALEISNPQDMIFTLSKDKYNEYIF